MKIQKKKLAEKLKSALKEAAAEGRFQNYARGTFSSMIKMISSGSIPNTPPYTKKAPGPGKSGPPGSAE
jgi:hypothetical protein